MTTYTEKKKQAGLKHQAKLKRVGGKITHAMKANGKTYCGKYPTWGIETSEIFTCGSCEYALSKQREVKSEI